MLYDHDLQQLHDSLDVSNTNKLIMTIINLLHQENTILFCVEEIKKKIPTEIAMQLEVLQRGHSRAIQVDTFLDAG